MARSIITLLLTAVTAVAATNVQYYKDGGCSSFLVEIDSVPQDGSCFNYAYSGTNSANIASCSAGSCWCTFWTQPNCAGASQTIQYPGCASNYGSGFASFDCWTG